MSLSEAPYSDRVDLAPEVLARLDAADESTHTAVALLIGTAVASPVLLAALAGHQDVIVALALYLVALVVSWLAVGLFVGAFSLAARPSSTEIGDEPEAAVEHRRSAVVDATAAASDQAEPDHDPVTR